MVIILPHGGQLQNYLKLDLGELENHLWAHVESKSSIAKEKKKKNLAGNIRALVVTLSSTILYPRMLSFFLFSD